MQEFLLLADYRRSFYSTVATQRTLCSMDVDRLASHFERRGHKLKIEHFSRINLAADFRGVPVLYTSSEDANLHYKSYIEDIILALETSGAKPFPAFKYLRAHHNKSMMEALRYQLFPEEAARLGTRCFGAFEELADARLNDNWPKIVKVACGAGSTGVLKVTSRHELLKAAKAISRTAPVMESLREYRSRLVWRGYKKKSLHRSKFVVQNMIPNMDGDFKVLCYGRRYYTLFRQNRPGDFRASGSGLFSRELPANIDEQALLNFAKNVTEVLDTPLASLDIGFDGSDFRLIEFQCLNFGTLTAEYSTYHHIYCNGGWTRVVEPCDLEAVLGDAVIEYQQSRLTGVRP